MLQYNGYVRLTKQHNDNTAGTRAAHLCDTASGLVGSSPGRVRQSGRDKVGVVMVAVMVEVAIKVLVIVIIIAVIIIVVIAIRIIMIMKQVIAIIGA